MRFTHRHRRAAVLATGALLVLSLVLLAGLRGARPVVATVAFSEFLDLAGRGQLTAVEIEPDRFVGTRKDGSRFQSPAPLGFAATQPAFLTDLARQGVRIDVRPASGGAMFSASALIVTLAFFAGLNSFGLGIIGSYVWRSFENTKQRPGSVILVATRPSPELAGVAGGPATWTFPP